MTIFAAFIIALFIALLFAPGYRKGNYTPLVIFFFVLFLAGVASQYWVTPFGPVWYGIAWMPTLFIILIFTLLFAAPSPYERNNISKASNEEKHISSAAEASISIYIWLLFTILLVAIIVGIITKTAL